MPELREFLDRILELKALSLAEVNVGENLYTARGLSLVKPPLPTALTVHTLTGLVDMVEALNLSEVVLHVENHESIEAIGKSTDVAGQRVVHIHCNRLTDENPFRFGNFYTPEEFAIALQSKFADSPDLDSLRVLASNVKQEAVTVNEDDGYSQKLSASAGVHLRSSATARPRVMLAPYRTFPEVEQPQSVFLFRARGGGPNEFPKLALFEADGGKWRTAATESIARALRVALGTKDISVVA